MSACPPILHRPAAAAPRVALLAQRLAPALLICALLALAGLAALPAALVLRQLLLAPWLEEIVFRLGLQTGLQAQTRWPWLRAHAAGLSALAFAVTHIAAHLAAAHLPSHQSAQIAVHVPPPALTLALAAATALPAWWIGRDFARHASLARCAAWHTGFNACWLLLLQPLLLSL